MDKSILTGIGMLAIIGISYFVIGGSGGESGNIETTDTEVQEGGMRLPVGSFSRSLAIGYEQNLLLQEDGSFMLFTDGALTDEGRWEWDQGRDLTLYGKMGGMTCSYLHSEDYGSTIMIGGGEPSYQRDE